MPEASWHTARKLVVIALSATAMFAEATPDVKTIVERSAAANDRDFEAASKFNYKEKDHDGKTTRIFQVTIIDGTPYRRLLAVGKPLSKAQAAVELKKEEKASAERRAQTPEQRNRRIAEYAKERKRDHSMMSQLSKGFDFKMAGTRRVGRRTVWILDAAPKPGYQPPNMESRVLGGMQGEMWIDQNTYEWVKVTAQVIHRVSIEGFLAEVEPGTRFEIEKIPVASGIWQISHFSMHSRAKVLHVMKRNSAEEDWYYDFKPVSAN
jgi:hypothetical protein